MLKLSNSQIKTCEPHPLIIPSSTGKLVIYSLHTGTSPQMAINVPGTQKTLRIALISL